MSTREKIVPRFAWLVAGVSALMIAAGILLWVLAMVSAASPVGLLSHQLTVPFSGVVFAALGGVVFAHHPRHPIGWMLTGLGVLSGIEMLNIGFLSYRSLEAPGEIIPAPDVAHWLAQWIWSPRAMVSLTLLLLLFPDGKAPSSAWRPFVWVAAIAVTVSTLSSAFTPGSWEGMGGIVRNPFVWQSPVLVLAGLISGGSLLALFFASLGSVVVRFRRSGGTERQQLKWMAYAMGVVVALFVAATAGVLVIPDSRLAAEIAFSLVNVSAIAIAVAASIAVLRYRLYDIDLIINRTIVYGALTILVVGMYVLTVGSLGALFQTRSGLLISLLATGVIAVLFQPVRERLQKSVNRMLYGERDEPYQVLSRLGRRLGVASAPEGMLGEIVETVAQTLKLPYVAIAMVGRDGIEQTSHAGHQTGGVIELPLRYRDRIVGQLEFGQRSPNEPFSDSEINLLRDIASQVALAVFALRLSIDLQRSRERLISAREEERRRLRRDLHDGLGPQLASLGLKIDATRNQIEHNPDQARELLQELRWEVKDAIADIRRLVYGLRPPVLDELGLTGALRASAVAQLSQAGSEVIVEGPDVIPALPAAVEVAAYRIAQEAVTNVARHANARHCYVSLSVDSDLQMEIRDDGAGLPETLAAGVGLHSMEERTAELGGSFLIEPVRGGGTRVRVRFPLPEGDL